jgi:hypothetical protein
MSENFARGPPPLRIHCSKSLQSWRLRNGANGDRMKAHNDIFSSFRNDN